jgi:ATP-binding protein involved in chromosome partitioning
VRECGDKGTPVVQAAPEGTAAKSFAAIAEALIERIASREIASEEIQAPTIDRSGGTGRKKLPVIK